MLSFVNILKYVYILFSSCLWLPTQSTVYENRNIFFSFHTKSYQSPQAIYIKMKRIRCVRQQRKSRDFFSIFLSSAVYRFIVCHTAYFSWGSTVFVNINRTTITWNEIYTLFTLNSDDNNIEKILNKNSECKIIARKIQIVHTLFMMLSWAHFGF